VQKGKAGVLQRTTALVYTPLRMVVCRAAA